MTIQLSLKGEWHINYILYMSYDVKEPGFENGYYKRYVNCKYHTIEEVGSCFFQRGIMYFSLYADGPGKLEAVFKFAVGPSRKSQEKARNSLMPKRKSSAQIFVDANRDYFGNMTSYEKKLEFRRIRMMPYNRIGSNMNYIEKNMEDAFNITQMKQKNIEEMDDVYTNKLRSVKSQRKDIREEKQHVLFYKMEKNSVRKD